MTLLTCKKIGFYGSKVMAAVLYFLVVYVEWKSAGYFFLAFLSAPMLMCAPKELWGIYDHE